VTGSREEKEDNNKFSEFRGRLNTNKRDKNQEDQNRKERGRRERG
jgi:hypothetical protein